jgi:mannosyltransferase
MSARRRTLGHEAARRLETNPLVVTAVLGVATGLFAFDRLGERSIWGDEAISISYAMKPVRDFIGSVSRDPNMSLYYGLLWVWQRVFGDSVFAFRSMSVLFVALAVPILYAVGARLCGRTTGLIAALLLATNAFVLTYAQEARGYALVLLLTTTAAYFFVDALEGSRRSLYAYVAFSALAFYAHFFSVFVTLGQACIVFLGREGTATRRRWIGAFVAMGILVAPVSYRSLTLGKNPINWIPRPGLHALWSGLRSLAGQSALSVIALAIVLALAAPALLRRRRDRRIVLAVTWAFLPILVSFAVSQVHPLFVERYLIVSSPGVALLSAVAIRRLPPKAAALALAAVIACAAPSLWRWYHRPPLEDWKLASAFLAGRARQNDSVAYEMSWAIPALSYYVPNRFHWGPADDVLPAPLGTRVWLVVYHGNGSVGVAARKMQATLRARGLQEIAASDFRPDFQIELFAKRR